MHIKLFKLATAAITCLTLVACSSSTNDDTALSQTVDPDSISGELVIAAGTSNTLAIEALTTAATAFSAEYPNISITYIETDDDTHKQTIIETLTTNAPDVIHWFPGNRMNPLIADNLLDDVSDIWAANELDSNMPAAVSTMTRDGKQWGIPYSTYGWGVYYRKDIFADLNISEPTTWDEMLSAADTLKAGGITPITIGNQILMAAAGVFDYLNLRTNGAEVHNALLAGDIKYTDERIKAVFTTWKQMIDAGYFIEGHEELTWLDAIAPLGNGDAAMYIMGNFLVSQFIDATGSDENLGYFQFPTITPNILRAEDAPTDAYFLPRNANNKDAARAFLRLSADPTYNREWNKTLGQLPLHKDAELADNRFIEKTAATVNTASSLSQFFDRDAPAGMSEAAFEAFQEFMLDTTKLESLLLQLDEVQKVVY